jgi:hypothetical protein
MFVGKPIVRRKSLPVPPGRIANSVSCFDSMMPLATSEIVPSPPQAIIKLVFCLAASAASSRAWPADSVKVTENEPKCVRRSLAIFGPVLARGAVGGCGIDDDQGK